MGEMATLSPEGDVKVIWDSENEDEVESAREQFNRLRKKGFLAFKVGSKGKKSEQIREFDPEAEKVILTPPMVGG